MSSILTGPSTFPKYYFLLMFSPMTISNILYSIHIPPLLVFSFREMTSPSHSKRRYSSRQQPPQVPTRKSTTLLLSYLPCSMTYLLPLSQEPAQLTLSFILSPTLYQRLLTSTYTMSRPSTLKEQSPTPRAPPASCPLPLLTKPLKNATCSYCPHYLSSCSRFAHLCSRFCPNTCTQTILDQITDDLHIGRSKVTFQFSPHSASHWHS